MSNEFVRETCLLIRHDGMQTVRQDRLGKWGRRGLIAAALGGGAYLGLTKKGRGQARAAWGKGKDYAGKALGKAKKYGGKALNKAKEITGFGEEKPKPKAEPNTDSSYDMRLDRRGTQDPERRRRGRRVGIAAGTLGGVGGAALLYAAGTKHGRQNVRKAYGYGRQKAGEAYGWAREQGRKARDKAVEITGFGEGKNKASTKS